MMARVALPLEEAVQNSAPDQPASGCPLQRLIDALMGALRATVNALLTRRVIAIATHEVE